MAEKKSTNLLEVGEEMAPFEFTVSPELNQQYLYAVEEFHPRYWDKSELGAPIVHPSLLLNFSNRTRSPSFYLEPGWAVIHAQEVAEFINPARVGSKFRVTWKIENVYEKRGRTWSVADTLVTDEEGREILRRKIYSAFIHSDKKQ